MTFYNKIAFLLTVPTLAFSALEGEIDINVIIPNIPVTPTIDTVSIGTFYTANHQSYPLTPQDIKENKNQYPVFTPLEALTLLEKDSYLFKNVPKGQYVPLPISIRPQHEKSLLYISFKEDDYKEFTLIPLAKSLKSIPIKLYLIDTSKEGRFQKMIEVKPGKSYRISKAKDKSLFFYIPKKKGDKKETLNFKYYSLPLEVIYHAP